ncbi:GNAT family N-acetyltransferase [Mesorhizobium sp. YIM 152430]|uniref:GNAT family N-acetyltransferase n=1 Tax=Mesorhizobium sp. YIM 152430 TaxID=3031761 RepID=UPI0023D98BC0|nr:GNAT family N-acetyltransferase [Mesorhizobium sp. YIM 152430]MDF1598477.1 GNAT family N-acetyltransferase [Mesorhizobium sp. YIM 152430]
MTVTVRRLSRAEIETRIDDLAALRIEVFRAFPYLYDGDAGYERDYLATYAKAPGAVVIGAFDGEALAGAATASPLGEHHDEFAAPFAERGLEVDSFFYFGESVLKAGYRGRGIGVRFFQERERAAKDAGFSKCIFSAVIRPADHPMRPHDHVPLDRFWEKRGYRRLDGLVTRFSWRDVGAPEATEKPMEYWMKDLDPAT